MPTLTSLLSRDAVVSLDTIEQALQRQVLEGGEIDTALLELAKVPENVLASYRAASFGLPAVARAQLEKIAPDLIALLPREIASEQRLVPVALRGETLVLASAWPLPEAEQTRLATRLHRELSVAIATEARIQAALAAHYELELPSRMRLLLARLAGEDAGELCEVKAAFPSERPAEPARIPSILRDDDDEDEDEPDTPRATPEPAPPPASKPRPHSRPPGSPVRVLTMVTLGSNGAALRDSRGSAPAAIREVSGEGKEDVLETRPARPSRMPPPPGRASIRAMRRLSKLPRGPLPQRHAVDLLSKARDRDGVLEAFFAFARQYFDCTVLFAVRDERLLGLESSGLPQLAELHTVEVPIARGGNVQGAIHSRAARVVHLTKSGEDGALIQAIRRAAAQPCALLPVLVRQRVVALLYGDRSGEPLELGELADLLATMPAVSSAFERIIQVRKLEAQHARPGTESDAPQGTFSQPPPSLPAQGARGPSSLQPEMHSAGAAARKAFGEAPPRPTSDDLAERPTMQLAVEEIEAAAKKRAGAPGPLLSLPQVGARNRREQDITRPARPSRLMRSATAETEPDLADPDEPADPPSPRTLSHPPPGVGSYAVRGGQQDVVDVEERAKAAQERVPIADIHPRAPRPDPRREDAKASQPEPDVVAIPASVRDSILPPRKATPATPTALDPVAEAKRLVDQLAELGPDEEEPVITALLVLDDPALEALERKFPGALWFDRHKLRTHMPAGRDVSAIARALFAFEARALPRVAALLGSSKPEVRLCALLVAKDWPDPALVSALADRIYDSDGPVRLLALETLPVFQGVAGFTEVLKALRARAGNASETVQNRLCALEALSVLRDAGSLDLLAEVSGHDNRQLSVPAHRALIAITGQDFGTVPRKWRSWIERNRRRHRTEWLIDGLMHTEERVRATAAAELQKLTQVYYGFVASASRRDRERAQDRYREWWETIGRQQLQ